MSDRIVRVVLSADASGLRREAGSASTALDRLGRSGSSNARGVESSVKSMGNSFTGTVGKVAALAGGVAAAVGGFRAISGAIKSTFQLGMDFQSNLNELGAVANVSGKALDDVGARARALGNDIDLPTASASDAAQAMLELAKGNLTAKEAMDAAKGTLTLAAAAQIDGASAAEIQANALNTFSLSADQAGHVADVLANTANAASGTITDFAAGLAQSGSVAAGFGISLDDTATVLGLFANNGVKGSDAGTSFKTMLTQLAAPSAQAKAAMDVLGLSVYDAGGTFVGTAALTDQLAKAQGRLTQEQFNAAATTVFGTDALRGANILAKGGAVAYDQMSVSVKRAGGAQTVATAQTKGLKGALGLVKNAVQDVQLNAFDKLAPGVEKAVRGVAGAIPGIAEVVLPVFGHIVDSATQFAGQIGDVFKGFGPDNVSAVLQGGAKIGSAVSDALKAAFSPESLQIIGQFAGNVLTDLIGLASTVTAAAGQFFGPIVSGAASLIEKASPYVTTFVDIVKGTITEITPLGQAIGDFFHDLATNGTVDIIGGAFTGLADVVKGTIGVIVPILSGAIEGLGHMGPVVTTATVALGAMLILRGPLTSFFGQIQARAASAAVSLAASNGIAGAAGVAAGGLSRVAGILGGPWGLAIGAGVAALFAFASGSDEATAKTTDFSDAIDASTGKLNENAATTIAAHVRDQVTAFQAAGGAVGVYTAAVSGNATAQNQVIKTFEDVEAKTIRGTDLWTQYGKVFEAAGVSAQDVAHAQIAGGSAVADLTYKVQLAAAANSQLGVSANDVSGFMSQFGDATSGTSQQVGQARQDFKDMSEQLAASAITANDAAASQKSLADQWSKVPEYLLAAQDYDKANHVIAGSFTIVGDAARASRDEVAAAAAQTAISDELKEIGDAASFATDQISIFSAEMDRLNGVDLSVAQAQRVASAEIRDIGKSYRDQADAAKKLADAKAALKDAESKVGVADDNGKVAVTPADVQAAARAVVQAEEDKRAAVDATLDSIDKSRIGIEAEAQATGKRIAAEKGYTAGLKATQKVLQDRHDQALKQIVDNRATGVSIADATKAGEAYLKTIGLVPDKKKTEVAFETANAKAKADELKKKADAATANRKAKLEVKTEEALKKAAQLKTVGIDATVDRKGNLIINNTQAVAASEAAKQAAIDATQNRTGTLSLITQISADAGSIASSIVNSIQGILNMNPVTVRASSGVQVASANGNVLNGSGVKMFANGGFENHVAQISRPGGPTRIWGEPETQGEGYVPLAPSKRKRSNLIMGELARRMGGHFISDDAQFFADGGFQLFAAGGLPSAVNLSGRTVAAAGPELANVVQALQDIATAVQAARDAAVQKSADAHELGGKLLQQRQSERQAETAAQAKLTAAKKVQDAETSKTTAKQKAADAARVLVATTDLAKVKQVQAAKSKAAQTEYDHAVRQAVAYTKAATLAERFQKAQQATFRAQQARAAQIDRLTAQRDSAADKLGNLKSDRVSLAGGIASTVSGFDGGITGHPDTRTSFATILKGQQYQLAQVGKFNRDISKLRQLGLSNDSLNEIASKGVEGGGSFAAALAGASKAQIKQLNGVTGQIAKVGANVGNTVAGQFYDAGIQAANGLVNGLNSKIGAIQKVMNAVASAVVSALTTRLKIHSPSQVFHELGEFTAAGFANGLAAGTDGVASAMDSMAALPTVVPTSGYVTTGGARSAQPLQIAVYLDGERIDQRAQLIVNGTLVELHDSYQKVGSQS